jgi:hypothetical protein
MTLRILVDNMDTKQLMERNMPQLQKSLGDQSVRIERFEIMLKQDTPQFAHQESNDARQDYPTSDRRQQRNAPQFDLFPEQTHLPETITNEPVHHRQRVQRGLLEVVA